MELFSSKPIQSLVFLRMVQPFLEWCNYLSSLKVIYKPFDWYTVQFKGSHVEISIISIPSLRIAFIVANSADPDVMPHSEAFQLGLHA